MTQPERIAVLETEVKGIHGRLKGIDETLRHLGHRPIAGGSNGGQSVRERIQAQATPERGIIALLIANAARDYLGR